MSKPDKNQRLDRHSGTGNRGLSKKEGHARKGGWGRAGTGEEGEAVLNSDDPNYNSDEEEIVPPVRVKSSQTKDSSSPVEQIIREFFALEDFEETRRNLEKLDRADLHPQFVKKVLFAAMDKQAYERELVSKLLSRYYGNILTRQEICDGFQKALDAVEDANLDIPTAPNLLAKFLARAVADEIIPPIFFSEVNVESSQQSRQTVELANGIFTEQHASKRLEYIWGPGNLKSVKRLKEEVRTLIEEYLVNEDKKEAEKSVRNLNAHSFHFQIVKYALRLVIEKGTPSDQDKVVLRISELLKYLSQVALISEEQFRQGFNCVYDSLEDLKLDVPNAESSLKVVTEIAERDGWLKNFQKN